MNIDIKIEGLDRVIKNLDNIAKKQIPFAASKALNDTAKDVQEEILKELPRKFTLRKPWYKPRTRFGINIKPATKSNLQSEVFTRAPWMQLHETGGIKKPAHKHLAVPTENIRRTKAGLIGKAKRPLNLTRAFKIISKTGQPMIMQRKGKKIVKPMYMLEPKARIKPVLNFIQTGIRVVKKNFNKNFSKAFSYAMRTARK